MKKTSSILLLIGLLSGVLFSFGANAATDNKVITNNLDILSTIAIDCGDETVTMGAITGTGSSALATNSETCNIKTNNSTGYSLTWQASSATMANANTDTIAAYTPAGASPEVWSVDAANSEWGGHLGSASTTINTTTWGSADTYAAGKWFNVNNASAYEIANRTTETSASGDDEVIFFGAEVGANKWQPTGTYTVNVTMTATTN